MKKFAMSISSLLVGLAAISLTACSSSGNGNQSNTEAAPVAGTAASDAASATSTLNIRYIDSDSLLANYNLAKDLQEATMRAVSRIDNARQAKGTEIQKFAAQVQQKAQSNGYLSEASYNADMQKLQKMQQDAENYLANLSRNADNELAQQQIQLNDSIESFIKDYNKSHGYDAILYKNAGVYFNPALDITAEVIKGLNSRYTKAAESK